MKMQNQTLLVILAIIFAVALALTVSIICLASDPSLSKTPKETNEDSETPITELFDDRKEDGLVFSDNSDGTVTLIGIGTCKSACINIPEYTSTQKRVSAIAANAFLGCTEIVAIQIPATVTSIGDLAFANCERLVYLSVNPENPAFADDNGVLYSKDFSILYCYPPMHAGNSVTLPAQLTAIKEMAFYHCAYLTNISYPGNEESWEAISVAPRNYSLSAAAKQFNVSVN